MAKTVKILLNIGKDDKQKYQLKEAYRDGDLVALDDDVASEFIRKGWALEYTDEVKKADEAAEKEAADRAIAAAMPLAAREVAKDEAAKRLKGEAKKEVKQDHAAKKLQHPTSTPSDIKEKPATNDDFGTKPVSSRDVQ